MYRERIDSFNELPKDKRPPRDLWDKPYALEKFLDTVWDVKKDKKDKGGNEFIYDDFEDVD